MKSLYQYILEVAGDDAYMYGANLTAGQVSSHFTGKHPIAGIKPVTNGSLMPAKLILKLYEIWERDFHADPAKIPFRFNPRGKVKVCDVYQAYFPEWSKVLDEYKDRSWFESDRGDYVEIVSKGGTKLRLTWGNGSIGKNMTGNEPKGTRSMKHEASVGGDIKEILTKLAPFHNQDGKFNPARISRSEYESLSNRRPIHILWNLYDNGVFDYALREMVEHNANPDEFVIATGSSNTHRNDKCEIWDNEFNIDPKNIEKVLHESGFIIADHQVKTGPGKDDVANISVKMQTGQLSGPTFPEGMDKNKGFWDALKNGVQYEDIKDEKYMIPFNNLCDTLCISAKSLYDAYLIDDGKGRPLEVLPGREGGRLGMIFQKLVGGNYWYVKPNCCIFVTDKDVRLKFKVESASISDGNRSIYIKGRISNIPAEVCLRTSNRRSKYPDRIFPIINIQQLVSILSEK